MPIDTRHSTGFFGKIPARGDFVGAGLPAAAVRAWDTAMSALLDAARTALAERWPEVWLEAPVWRFALPGGICGPDTLLGLWMPSVDRAGRYFPLMIAVAAPGALAEAMARVGTDWLDAAEDAGRSALADDLGPDQLAALIPPPPALDATADLDLPYGIEPAFGDALWWTDGSPLVPAHGFSAPGLPDAATFVAMLAPEDSDGVDASP